MMKIFTLISLTLVTGAFLLGYSSPSYSATFFKCQSGYSFETNRNNSARCFKAASKKYKQPLRCPNKTIPIINKSIGHFLRKDYQGNADKCVGQFKVGPISNVSVLDMVCPSGYRLLVKSRSDRCSKNVKAQAIKPSVRVTR